jgi:hypothetical protein
MYSLAPAAAPVYERVGVDGEKSFSDHPAGDATELWVAPVQTYEAPVISSSVFETSRPIQESHGAYTAFEILSPAPGATFRNNGGSIPFELALSPELRPNDEIRFFMDGTEVVEGRSISVTLDNVDRGAHTVYAEVVDEQGQRLVRSDPVSFHLHRTSIPSRGQAIPFGRTRTRVAPASPAR